MPTKKRTTKKSSGTFDETPRVLSAEEKHELIKAHAALRSPQDPVQRLTLWAGVLIAMIAIVAGWWYTVGTNVRETIQIGTSDLREKTQELDAFTNIAEQNPIVNPPALPGVTSEASAAQFAEILNLILVGEELPTSTRRDDLLAPASTTTKSTSTNELTY